MKNIVDLTGKTILVTGASDGIGRQTSKTISEVGGKVILVGRSEEKLNAVLSELTGDGHAIYSYDLKNVEGIDGFIKDLVKTHGALDGLVHCAGESQVRPLKMCNPEFMKSIFEINYFAFIELVRAYSMKKNNNGGSIVVMSSVGSRSGDKGKLAYTSSKAAVDGAVRTLAKELAEKNIRVNSVVAGMIKTGIYDRYVEKNGEEAMQRVILSRQYLGVGQTDDVANAITYLLSDAAKFITGTGIAVDGGYLSC